MLKNIILLFMILSFPLYMRGEEVCRIVSLSPAVTEIICHLGGEKYLAGRSSACNYPESVKKLPVAGDFAKPYMEKILLFRPRYLLTNDLINPAAAKKFDSVGIKLANYFQSTQYRCSGVTNVPPNSLILYS